MFALVDLARGGRGQNSPFIPHSGAWAVHRSLRAESLYKGAETWLGLSDYYTLTVIMQTIRAPVGAQRLRLADPAKSRARASAVVVRAHQSEVCIAQHLSGLSTFLRKADPILSRCRELRTAYPTPLQLPRCNCLPGPVPPPCSTALPPPRQGPALSQLTRYLLPPASAGPCSLCERVNVVNTTGHTCYPLRFRNDHQIQQPLLWMRTTLEGTMQPPGANLQAPAPASRAAAALLAATLAFTALPAVDPVSILLPPAHAEEEVADVSER